MGRIGSLLVRMGLATDEASFQGGKRKLNSFSRYTRRRSNAIERSFMRIGGAITGAFAVGSVIQNAAATIGNFEQSVANLSAITGKTQGEMSGLVKAAKEIGARSAFSASEVVLLQTELAKLGFTEREIIKSTEAVGDFSIALGTDAASAAAFAGSSLRSFGIDASQTESVMDMLAKATTKSALDFEKLNVGLSIVGPVAKAANVDIARTTSILGVLADRGLDASTAGSSLRNIYLDLAAKGLTFNEAMQQINSSTNKLNTANELFGKRGATTALILAENSTAVDVLDESLRRANGTLETMTDKRLSTLQGQVTLMKSAWEGFVLSIESGNGVIGKLVSGTISFGSAILTALTPTEDLTKAVLAERTAFNQLIGALKDVNTTDSTRAAVIKELNRDYPDLVENIDLQTVSLEELVKIQKEYNEESARNFRIAEGQTEYNKLLKEQRQLQEDLVAYETDRFSFGKFNNQLAGISDEEVLEDYRSKLIKVEARLKTLRENFDVTGNAASDSGTKVEESGNKSEDASSKVDMLTDSIGKKGEAYENLASKISASSKLIEKLTEQYVLSGGTDKAKLTAIDNEISKRTELNSKLAESLALQQRLSEGLAPDEDRPFDFGSPVIGSVPIPKAILSGASGGSAIQQEQGERAIDVPEINTSNIASGFDNGVSSVESFAASLLGLEGVFANLNGVILENQAILADDNASPEMKAKAEAALNAAEAQKEAAAIEGAAALQSASDVVSAARQAIKAEIAKGIARAITANIGFGPLGLIAAGAAAASANSLFDKFIPKLANGGIIDSPTFAMLGEYPGAKNNVEIATPEKLMRKIVREEGGGGGMANIYLDGLVEGGNLRIVLDRAEFENGRV